MKLNRILLGGTAIIITALTAVSFKSSNRFSSGTLCTWNGSGYNNVQCERGGSGGNCPSSVTYYTRINHTNVGKLARVALEG